MTWRAGPQHLAGPTCLARSSGAAPSAVLRSRSPAPPPSEQIRCPSTVTIAERSEYASPPSRVNIIYRHIMGCH